MNSAFLDSISDKKDLLKSDNQNINKFFLENNVKQIEEIQRFFEEDIPVLLLNGFMGTGKSTAAEFSLSMLKNDVIVLKYNCFETTILDDILLTFFEEFKRLTVQNIIRPPKIKVDNFTQKVDAYFSVIEKPVLIVLDSFEAVLKDNKQEIIDFVFHLSFKPLVKTIFISRVFDYSDFEGKIPYMRTTVLALDKSLFEKYLRSEGIKFIGPVSDELYKYSRGYFLYTLLSLKVINAHKLSLIDFIKGFTKSFLSYNDFILREALGFVDPVSGHLFRFLTIMRHPVSINLLKTLNLFDEQRLNFFVENRIISRNNDMIYLKDYYKEIALNSIPESVSVKLHRACVDLYNTQLPLKPFERDLLISRQTMRSEIEYHGMFIPKRPVISPVNTSVIQAVEYSAQSVDKVQDNIENKTETKEEKLKNISFIFDTEEEEQKIMSDIANSINKFIDYSNKTLNEEETKLSLREMLNAAKNEENKYNFKKAAAFYQRALLMKEDDDFYTFLPLVYTKLAKAYSELKDWFNSLRYYDLALEFYNAAGDVQKSSAMKLEIANIFYITFKHDKAKLLLDDILAMQGLDVQTAVKAYLALSDVERNDLPAVYSACKKALEIVDGTVEKSVLAELYFKYAAVCDDLEQIETSVKYYKKCIEIDKNNPHLSAAYANLAQICYELDYSELAIKYYSRSLELDTKDKNLNGMFTAAMKLADLNRRKEPEKAFEFYRKASQYASEMNEPFYQISVYTEFGDFCVIRKDLKAALKNYFNALNIAKNNSSSNNISGIEQRIGDIKIRLGDSYQQIENEILNEK